MTRYATFKLKPDGGVPTGTSEDGLSDCNKVASHFLSPGD